MLFSSWMLCKNEQKRLHTIYLINSSWTIVYTVFDPLFCIYIYYPSHFTRKTIMNRITIASTPSPTAVVAAGEDATVTPRPNLAVDMNEKTTILGRLFYNSSSPVSSSSLRTTSKKTKKNSTVNSTDIRKHDVAIVPQSGGANKQTTTTTKRKQEEPSRSSSPFGPYDILCGREKNIFNHVGNRRFRMTIGMNIPHYEHAQNKTSKAHVIRDVTHLARNEMGYRFLKKKTNDSQQEQPVCITTTDPTKGINTLVEYIELTESEARKKVRSMPNITIYPANYCGGYYFHSCTYLLISC